MFDMKIADKLYLIVAVFFFQTVIDDLFFSASLLRFEKVEHGHLRLLFALPVLDALLFFLCRGLGVLVHFLLFGVSLNGHLVIGQIFIRFRLFVVKRVRLIIVNFYKARSCRSLLLFHSRLFVCIQIGKLFQLIRVM